jgi:hypothetical protein
MSIPNDPFAIIQQERRQQPGMTGQVKEDIFSAALIGSFCKQGCCLILRFKF